MTTRYVLIMVSIIAALAAGLVTVLVLAPGKPSGSDSPVAPSAHDSGKPRRPHGPHGPARVPAGKGDTPPQRWQRVEAMLGELRDRRIPANPNSPKAYDELGWLFLDRMTRRDKLHRICRQQWAGRMQRLLAAPPYASTPEVLDHFRAIAAAPLDRSLAPAGLQGEALQRNVYGRYLAAEPDVDRCARELAVLLAAAEDRKEGLRPGQIIGRRLLEAYHRLSQDPAVEAVRAAPPRVAEADKPLAELINSEAHAPARRKLLALVRAHTWWNHYRLDPRRMLELMERLGPLDWRGGYPHAMYWLSLGAKRCRGLDLTNLAAPAPAPAASAPALPTPPASAPAPAVDRSMDELNTCRTWLNCMKSLVWQGRVSYIEPAREGEAPYLALLPDVRFVQPAQRMHDQVIRRLLPGSGQTYEGNFLREGHLNFLAAGIGMLYADGRRAEAGELLDWARDTYKLKESPWDRPLEAFVLARLKLEGMVVPRQAAEQIDISLRAGLLALAQGRREGNLQGMRYAKRVHDACQENQAEQGRLGPFEDLLAAAAGGMLLAPRKVGYYLPLASRARLWASLDDDVKRRVYDSIAAGLREQCAAHGLDFGKCFPPPPAPEKGPQQDAPSATRP